VARTEWPVDLDGDDPAEKRFAAAAVLPAWRIIAA
jgi:hypothetical protein